MGKVDSDTVFANYQVRVLQIAAGLLCTGCHLAQLCHARASCAGTTSLKRQLLHAV